MSPALRRLTALLLAAALLLPALSGCSVILEREYLVTAPHEEQPVTDDDENILQVETYQELVNSILYFVDHRMEHGVVRLINYPRDVESDLSAACLEVSNDAPIGAYAVSNIRYDSTRVVKYYEANLYITYRRTAQQMDAVRSVIGASAIRGVLAETLSSFGQEAVMQVSYFAEDEAYISGLVRQTYYDTPDAALGMPEYTITLYPEQGSERIVEVRFTYALSAETLAQRRQTLQREAEDITAPLQGQTGQTAVSSLFRLLRKRVPQCTQGATAYEVLLNGQGDSEGMALAFQLLCQCMKVESVVVQGTLDGAPHFWNVVTFDDGTARHVDATREDGLLLDDDALTQMGYTWDRDETPACTPAAQPEISPQPSGTP